VNVDCLIVDDEIDIASGTSEYFNLFGVSSGYALTASDALAFLASNTVRLILLDISLGEDSGLALCKTLRETMDLPILFISAHSSTEDQLNSLSIGGDDHIAKPFSVAVLLAKVKAVLARVGGTDSYRLRVDPVTKRICLDATPLDLRPKEYQLLRYLIDNRGRVVTKEELLDKVWGTNFVGDSTLSVHVRRLREKIEADPNEPVLIKTVWGVGYVCDEDT